MSVDFVNSQTFDIIYPVVIIGGGATGLCAGLAARDCGVDAIILERDKTPLGTTAMSTGLIPAAGTKEQCDRGIEDTPDQFASDILKKTKNLTDAASVHFLTQTSADTVDWLINKHEVTLSLLDGFLYPGHSAMRMYGMPNRSGNELMGALTAAAETAGVDILTEATVTDLIADKDRKILGVRIKRPDGQIETIGCETLILACCGFAGDADLVETYIPEMTKAVFHGHPGNKGDAIIWGKALGAEIADMAAYQGHAGLAFGHSIPILWPLIMEGGFQVNLEGKRFSDESKGYSEQAVKVLAQTDSIVFSVFDERLYELMTNFDDFQDACKAGAILKADTLQELAEIMGVPTDAFKVTFEDVKYSVKSKTKCKFGRKFTNDEPLNAPFFAAKVTGALFHTQGGLSVDTEARVLQTDGSPLPNLFAGGGAARGISGPGADGYIAGNGLLTATSYGKLAGRAAAKQILISAS